MIGQDDVVGKGHIAAFVEQTDMTVGRHHVGALIVGNRVRQQDAPVVIDFDMAFGDDGVLVGVVDRFLGLQQDVAAQFGPLGHRGRRKKERRQRR